MDNSLSWFDKRLDAFYRATFYQVDHLSISLRVDEPSSELDRWLKTHDHTNWAFITAWNPASKPVSVFQNERAQSALRRNLLGGGYDYYPALGIDPSGKWPPEPSLFIPEISVSRAAEFAYAFRQNAFLAGKIGQAVALHWTMPSFSMMNDK